MSYLNNLSDLKEWVNFDFRSIVLVGSAHVDFSDSDYRALLELKYPVFVYMNHGVLAEKLRNYYPDDYRELLVIRKRRGGYHGVRDDGKLYFNPASLDKFVGVLCINGGGEGVDGVRFSIRPLGGDLYKASVSGYESSFKSGKVSPTTGYFCEKIFFNLLEAVDCSEKNRSGGDFLYTVGMGLDSNVPRFSAHNIDFEQSEQEEKFASGKLISIGKVIKSHSPFKERED